MPKASKLTKSDGWVPYSESGRELKLYSAKKEEKPVVIEKPVNFYKIVSESKEVMTCDLSKSILTLILSFM